MTRGGEFFTVESRFTEINELFSGLDRPVIEEQGVKTYPDGTEVVINRYAEAKGMPEGAYDTFSINIRHLASNQGAHFVVNMSGLVDVSINGQEVSLRSHLYPRPTDNLRIRYNDETEESKLRTPLTAFREAAKPLVQWAREIDSNQSYTPPPISIVEKNQDELASSISP